jgi:hypothetical protein
MRVSALTTLLWLSISTLLAQPDPPDNLSGKALREWFIDNWYAPFYFEQNYRDARIDMYSFVDERSDGRVYCVYTGFSQPSETTSFLDPINAEHTVPQSFFGNPNEDPMRSDIHHLFPTHGSVNSARSNFPFGEIDDNQTDTWYGIAENGAYTTTSSIPNNSDEWSERLGQLFEPREDHKGDAARAIFYFYTIYEDRAILERGIDEVGDVDILFEWHLQDPPSNREMTRNNRIEQRQGNRNFYVDNPEWVALAFGFETPPSVNIDASLVDFGDIKIGAVSSTQSYTVAGSDLEDALTIAVAEPFELSLSEDSDFAGQLNLSPNEGNIPETIIYVRLNPGEGSVTGPVSESIDHNSSGLETISLTVSGNVLSADDPNIVVSASELDLGQITAGDPSTVPTYHIEASD